MRKCVSIVYIWLLGINYKIWYTGFMEEVKSQENNAENIIPHKEEDENSISEAGPIIGNDINTSPDKVYRQVQGMSAIEDLYDVGMVRSSTSATETKEIENTNSKGKKTVYWTRGVEGKGHIVPRDGYVIEAPYDIAKEGLVKKESITAIYTKLENNEVINVLENPSKFESDIIEYRLNKLSFTIENQKRIIDSTTSKVNEIRSRLGAEGEENNIPSIDFNKKEVIQLENKKIELQNKLQEILKSDVSEKHTDIINEIKQSKIDWAHSEELTRRLKLKGATDEDVLQIKNWLIDNTTNAKTFILPPSKFKEVVDVLHEMTGEENIKEGRAFYLPGGRDDVPENIKSSVFMQENIAKPPIPGQEDEVKNTIDKNTLHHELGHVAQDGLLESELYNDWNPKFKDSAPDKNYVGLINETDTRIRSMYRELGEVFDPQKEVFGKKHLEILKNKLSTGKLNKDTEDLFKHYDDATLIKLANRLPAI